MVTYPIASRWTSLWCGHRKFSYPLPLDCLLGLRLLFGLIMLIGLFYFLTIISFLVSDPLWYTKLAIRQFFFIVR